MALDSGEVLRTMRGFAGAVSGVTKAYSQGDSDDYKLPIGASTIETPAVIIERGPTTDYTLLSGFQRATYDVVVYVALAQGDAGELAANSLTILDAVIAAFIVKVKLGLARVTQFKFMGDETGFTRIEWGAESFWGHRLRFQVMEDGSTATAAG